MNAAQLSALSPEQLIAIIQQMAAQGQPKLSLKVSEKGALSMYGMGRWPVTLYKSQWRKLLAQADAIEAFIKDHDSVLAEKPIA